MNDNTTTFTFKKDKRLLDTHLDSFKVPHNLSNTAYVQYRCCPRHSEGQLENSMVKEIAPGDVEASDSPGSPAVTEKSLEGAGK